MLSFVTVNVTSGGKLHRLLEGHDAIHVVAVQEHKIAAEGQALQELQGWRSCWSGCSRGPQGGLSAGVGLLWRTYLAHFGDHCEVVPGRVVGQGLYTTDLGALWVYSVYGISGRNATRNKAIFDAVMVHAGAHGLPFSLMGDFNMEPGSVEDWLRESGVPGGVLASAEPTCFPADGIPTTIDFGVAHVNLLPLFAQPHIYTGIDVATHNAVRFDVTSEHLSKEVDVVRAQPRSHPVPVVGPHWPSDRVDWTELHGRIRAFWGRMG